MGSEAAARNGHQNALETIMISIGFGLLLYKILTWLLYFLVPMLVIPFLVNLWGGKGYFHYAGTMWRFVGHTLSLGLFKHKPVNEA